MFILAESQCIVITGIVITYKLYGSEGAGKLSQLLANEGPAWAQCPASHTGYAIYISEAF